MDENAAPPQWSSDEEQSSSSGVPELAPIQWSASEFISHQKTAKWYVGLGCATAIITIIVLLITRSIMSGVVVALACGSLGVLGAKKPETKTYTLDDYGIRIGDRSFPYEAFKSFSLVEEGAMNCIWLRPLKRYTPTTAMYFAPSDEDKILSMLENFLPDEERQLDTIDRLSRRIRF